MRILFDIISLQGFHNGGEEYTRRVLKELLSREANLVGIYDSKLSFLDNDWEWLNSLMPLYDININSISNVIKKENINKFYIGIGQRYNKYDLSGIDCRVLCTIHDLYDIELFDANIIESVYGQSLKGKIKDLLKYVLKFKTTKPLKRYMGLIQLLSKDKNEIITVSNYTCNSLKYFFQTLQTKELQVLYSPAKETEQTASFENSLLSDRINKNNKYLLAVSADRPTKNIKIIKEIFPKIRQNFPDLKLVLTTSGKEEETEDILYLDYVSGGILNYYIKMHGLLCIHLFLKDSVTHL